MLGRIAPYVQIIIGPYQASLQPTRQISNKSDFLTAVSDGKTVGIWISVAPLFIDFKSAYDSIARVKLYTAMREFDILTKLIRLTRLTNARGQIKAAGSLSRPFDINIDLTQGDALSCAFRHIEVVNLGAKPGCLEFLIKADLDRIPIKIKDDKCKLKGTMEVYQDTGIEGIPVF